MINSYVANSTGKGNYNEDVNTNKWKGNVTICGSSESYKVKNIYDLAGNIAEWTMEASLTDQRISRGGYYANTGVYAPVSIRDNEIPDSNDYATLGFRVALYL